MGLRLEVGIAPLWWGKEDVALSVLVATSPAATTTLADEEVVSIGAT
jgi:hypothetical protein